MFYKTFTSIILLLTVVASRQLDLDYSVSGGLYEIEVSPKTSTHNIGETFSFECIDKQENIPEGTLFTWKHNGVEIGNGKKLERTVTKVDDAGEYECVVEDSTSKAILSVTNSTAVKINTATRNSDENRVSIICSFENVPADLSEYTFEWLDKSGERISSLPNDIISIEELRNKQPLTCRAMHRNGNVLQAGLTYESVISPSVLSNVVHNVKAEMRYDRTPSDDEPLVLSNSFTGDYDKILEYTWKKDGRYIGSDATYRIEQLNEKAKGLYTCDIVFELDGASVLLHTTLNLGSNEEDYEDEEINLSITPSKPFKIKVNTLMEIHCTISDGNDYFANTIKWKFIPKRGGMRSLEGWSYENFGKTSTIKKIVQTSDLGEYVCTMESIGKSAQTKMIKRGNEWTVAVTSDQASTRITLDPPTQRVIIMKPFRFVCEVTGKEAMTILPTASTTSGVNLVTRQLDDNKIEITGIASKEVIDVTCELHGVKTEGKVYATCEVGQKMCPDGRCILQSASCDGNIQECDPIIRSCGIYEGRPFSKSTYNVNWECDGENDCGNGYDEADCSNNSREICGKEYTCPNGIKKIPFAYVCDGEADCNGGSDENECSNPSITSTVENKYKVRQGQSITLTCQASGKPAPRIIWRFNWGCLRGQNMGDSQIPYLNARGIERYRISSSIQNCESNRPTVVSRLEIQNFDGSDAGFYNCEAISGQKRHLSENYHVQMMQN